MIAKPSLAVYQIPVAAKSKLGVLFFAFQRSFVSYACTLSLSRALLPFHLPSLLAPSLLLPPLPGAPWESTFGERGWLHDDVFAGAAAAFYCAAKGALEHVLDHYTGAVEVRAVDSWGALYRRLPLG